MKEMVDMGICTGLILDTYYERYQHAMPFFICFFVIFKLVEIKQYKQKLHYFPPIDLKNYV